MGQSNESMYGEEEQARANMRPAESTYDFSDFPEDLTVKTTSGGGGEVGMSLEESNRVREKLGLKTLRTGESDRAKKQREAEEDAHLARLDAEKAKETAALAVKIAAAKEKRLMESRNRATKQLGEADEADDDLSQWVQKSRKIEEKRKAEDKRKADEFARKLEEQDEDAEDSDEEDGGGGGGGGGGARRGQQLHHAVRRRDDHSHGRCAGPAHCHHPRHHLPVRRRRRYLSALLLRHCLDNCPRRPRVVHPGIRR